MSSKGLAIGISAGAVAIREPGSHRSSSSPYAPPSQRLAPTPSPLPDLRGALAQALSEHKDKRQVATVTVGDDLARHWLQAPPRGVGSLRELQAVAASRFQELFGEQGPQWSVTGDWRTASPFVCAAIPHWLRQAVQDAIAGQRPPLHTLLSTTLANFQHDWPADGWWCVRAPATLAIGCMRDGRVSQLRTLLLTGLPAQTDMLRLAACTVRQETARDAAADATDVAWIDLAGADDAKASDGRAVRDGITFSPLRSGLHLDAAVSLDDLPRAQAVVAATLGARREATA